MLDYLAGLVAGDGCITSDRYGRVRIRVFDVSRRFLEDVCVLVETSIGYNCKVHWDGTVWYLSVYSKELAEKLTPRLANPLNRQEWLRGFVDAEGSIYRWVRKGRKVYYQLSITSTNISYIGNVKKALEDLGVEYRVTVTRDMWKPRYRVLISKVGSIRKFLLEVGFRHPLKLEKAYYALCSYY